MKVSDVIKELNGKHTSQTLSKELGVSEKKLRNALKQIEVKYDRYLQIWAHYGDETVLEQELESLIEMQTQRKVYKRTNMNEKVHQDTTTNESLTKEEILALKELLAEHQKKKNTLDKFHIYDDLSKIPEGVETERRAYTMSVVTINQLSEFAKKRRLPLQDLVELAVINLLGKYDVD